MTKVKNRIVSVLCVFVFTVGLLLVGVVSVKIAESIKLRNELIAIRNSLIAERDWQEANSNYGDDDYISVFVKQNYSIYDSEDTIFIFVK
ncbi:MAG: hypothetical protein PUA56_06295 [Bacillales bacterium]|nr:hypothetical protein [Bacillales bacterium]